MPTETFKSAGEISYQPDADRHRQQDLFEIATSQMPLYGMHWHRHSMVTMNVGALSRLLYYNSLYQQIVEVPGVICEFGVQWGATLAALINLRSIHEPFNIGRTIFGFDTFEGFVGLDPKDGDVGSIGDYSSTSGYEKKLERTLELLEAFAPASHFKKFQLIKGDASLTIDPWLKDNPHAVISMAIFDMDLYKPTKDVLEKILPRLTRGSLLVFDELNSPFFPGETTALAEVLGLGNLKLKRTPIQPYCAWAIYGD